jgi:DNA-binding MarR family transcriptional regulator
MAQPRSSGRRPAKSPSDPDIDSYVSAVLTASRVLIKISARSLASAEETVTLTQFRTLVVLHSRGPVNLNGLSDDLQVNASTALRMIDRLLAAGLVTRQENPDDRREVLLGLTPAGSRLVRAVTARRRKEIARVVDAMPAELRGDLVAALRAFNAAADEPEAGGGAAGEW